MGLTMIENEEYKKLILREKELEELKEQNQKEIQKNESLETLIHLEQREFKKIILLCVRNEKCIYEKYENYNIDSENIANYINKNYIDKIPLWLKEEETEEKE